METVTISSKGQIVIPARLRKRMKLKKGRRFIIEEEEEGIILKPLAKLSTMIGKYKVPGGRARFEKMRQEDEKDWIARMLAIKKSMKNG